MNNPFLSDRNIFSKVVNPLKKKSETDKKDSVAPETIPKGQTNIQKEPFISTSPLGYPQQPKQGPAFRSMQANRVQPQPKMTFGQSQQMQNRMSFNKNTLANPSFPLQKERKRMENEDELDYGYDSFKVADYSGNNYTNKEAKMSMGSVEQFKSPAQKAQFQQFRKVNNFKDYSPIIPQQQSKSNDSQFLNIDALGEDLNKLLAESKNQEELCQLLGINRKPQPNLGLKNRQEKKKPQANPVYDNRQERKMPQKQIDRDPSLSQKGPLENPTSAFMKQKPKGRQVDSFQPVQAYPSKPINQQEQQREYIPTFNYMGLQHQSETISRYEDAPRFSPVVKSERREMGESSKDNLQVFNYSSMNAGQSQKSVQQLLVDEMSSLCMNGKYRTFLTSNEKIVTVRYKLQPL